MQSVSSKVALTVFSSIAVHESDILHCSEMTRWVTTKSVPLSFPTMIPQVSVLFKVLSFAIPKNISKSVLWKSYRTLSFDLLLKLE